MRGVKIWLVEVGDGNGDTLDIYGPFLSQQEAENWITPRKACFPDYEYELQLITPKDKQWKHPIDDPYGCPERPRCEDCGEDLTARDLDEYWGENAPLSEIPRCCSDCAEKLED
jgi:hypothetical protein